MSSAEEHPPAPAGAGERPAPAGAQTAFEPAPGEEGREDGALVTFFVLAYRQEATVRAAIEGAFAQTYRPLEIILSDDASPDGTFRIMEEMAASYRGPHRVVLNRNARNLGLIGHLNRVMEIATGAFVVQNAGDDVSVPERTARLAAVWAGSGGRAKLVHSRALSLDAEGNLRPRQPGLVRPPMAEGVLPRDVIGDTHELIGAACGWARELFDVFGPLPGQALIEDRPIAFRAATLGGIAWIDAPLLHYREGGESDPATLAAGSGFSLHGYHLKKQRWWRSFMLAHLHDMERVAPPDAGTCRRLAKATLERLDFEIALAETDFSGRAAAIPQALGLTIRRRDPVFLRTALKYLFARQYARLVDRRLRRRESRRPT